MCVTTAMHARRARLGRAVASGILVTAVAASVTPVHGATAERGTPNLNAPAPATASGEVFRTPEEQRRFRQSMGLDTSDAALADAAAAANDAQMQFGVPLTDSELDELLRREAMIDNDAVEVRQEVLETFGSKTFGGIWMDNAGGGYLTVAVTQSIDAVAARLKSIVQDPAFLRVVQRPHSLDHLESMAARLRSVADQTGRVLNGVRVDERNGVLEVHATDVDSTRRWVNGTLGANAPVDVITAQVVSVGTRNNNSPPFRGGQAINGSNLFSCTSAFTAQGPGGFYVLTAGHCGKERTVWDQAGTPMGTVDRSDIDGTDAMRIPVRSPLINEVTLSYSPNLATEAQYQTITSSQP